MNTKKFISGFLILSQLLALAPAPARASLSEADYATLLKTKNYATNGGAENGKTGWTASGTSAVAGDLVVTTTAAGKYEGNGAFTWTPHNADNYLTNTSVTITSGGGLSSASCAAIVWTKTTDTTHALEAYDGTNVLNSVTIPSSTAFVPVALNWACSASGTNTVRLNAGSTTAISFDSLKWGDARGINLAQAAQAYKAGSLQWSATANCQWFATSGSYSNFASDNDCDDNARTALGIASDGSAGLRPSITLTNAPSGDYMVVVDGSLGQAASGATTSVGDTWRLYDGSTQYGVDIAHTMTSASASLNTQVPNLVFNFNLSAPFTGALDLQCKASGTNGRCTIDTISAPLKFTVYYLPAASSAVSKQDSTPASWSGYHDATCAWTRTNAAYGDPAADSTCVFTERQNRNFGSVTSYLSAGNKLPGIIISPPRVGRYFVCANSGLGMDTSLAYGQSRLYDVTNSVTIAETGIRQITGVSTNEYTQVPLCGIWNAPNLSSTTLAIQTADTSGQVTLSGPSLNTSVEWMIFELDAAMPTPYLVNGVVTPLAAVTTINAYVSKSANYTATTSDETILFTADATLTLPAAAGCTGKTYNVIASGVGTDVTIDPNASETVCGSTTKVISGNLTARVQSDGTNWQDISGFCGVVTMRAVLTTTQTGITDKVIPYNVVTTDTHSGMSGGTYTAKVAGNYAIHCHATLASSGSPNDDFIDIRINSSTVESSYCSLLTSGAGSSCNATTESYPIAIGDTVDCFVNGDASFNIDNNGTRTTFDLHRIF